MERTVPRHNGRLLFLVVLAFGAGPVACDTARSTGPLPSGVTTRSGPGFSLVQSSGLAQSSGIYDASLNTLPEAQGWNANVGIRNPAPPQVSGGVLFQNNTTGACATPGGGCEQYWNQFNMAIDFLQDFVLEADLRVISSNYIPNIGTGTREGYYFAAQDASRVYTIGLADQGFNFNSGTVPNQPLTPYPIADGNFHQYRFVVHAGKGSFSIDGVTILTNIDPAPEVAATPHSVSFGAGAGNSRSVTELRSFRYSTTVSTCAIDILPEKPNNHITSRVRILPVAVLGSPGCDVTAIVQEGITLGDGNLPDVLQRRVDGKLAHVVDVNNDDILDLIVWFSTGELREKGELSNATRSLTLSAVKQGVPFTASDAVIPDF